MQSMQGIVPNFWALADLQSQAFMRTYRLPTFHQHWRQGLMVLLLLAAVLPSALRLFGADHSQVWTQVCTPHGMRWVAIASDVSSQVAPDASSATTGDQAATLLSQAYGSKSQQAMGLLDCPLCLFQLAPSLPPEALALLPAPVYGQVRSLVWLRPSPRVGTRLAHSRPPTRAPPPNILT